MIKLYKEEAKSADIFLRIFEEGDYMVLAACDAEGDVKPGGYLLNFYSDGKVKRRPGVKYALGFDMDLSSDSRLRITNL